MRLVEIMLITGLFEIRLAKMGIIELVPSWGSGYILGHRQSGSYFRDRMHSILDSMGKKYDIESGEWVDKEM